MDKLNQLRGALEQGGWPDSQFYSQVLTYGHESYGGVRMPSGVVRGRQKLCFSNAGFLAITMPERFVYVEGYAAGYIVAHHAWNLDLETGKVVDRTWPWRKAREAAYIGIPFSVEAVRAAWELRPYAANLMTEQHGCWLKDPVEQLLHPNFRGRG